jgi:two-component sensor histidine kinase
VQTYFTQLLEEILQFYDGEDKAISISSDISDFMLSTQTLIPLGLIVNELVTNSFKHAFKSRENGEVSFSLTKDDSKISMTISDDGTGFVTEESENANLGMEIIHDLADQIDATFNFINNNGVTFHLEAPLK